MKNIKALLADCTKYPAAVEAKLPAGAPKLSKMLLDAANSIPAVPDFPIDIPAPPAPPALPELPAMPAGLGGQGYVTNVEVRAPAPRSPVTPLVQSYTQPIEGVVGTVTSRRGM